MRAARVLAVALLAGAPFVAVATDAPHDASSPTGTAINCESCHIGHAAPDGALTNRVGNYNLCASCHTTAGFGFPWTLADQAGAGSRGKSHRWDANPTNLGATAPSAASPDPAEAAMARHLDSSGKIQCSTCHDQHQSDTYTTDATVHTSVALNTNVVHAGSGTLQLTLVPPGAKAAGYTIKVSSDTTHFKISHDNGLTYFGYNGSTWGPDTQAGFTNGKAVGANVTLDDGLTQVTFSGALTLNDVFSNFYVSYPYLRADNTASRMCITCHKDRDMRWQDVRGGNANGVSGGVKTVTLGTTVFHHPTGQALGANSGGYDRANQGAILDANGTTQSVGTEGRKSNDLVLSSTGLVGCLTCHHPHNADSNSLSNNPR